MSKICMGFDFGMKKIGIAIGQSITGTANPLIIITAKDGQPDWLALGKIVKQWQPEKFIVGLPINMDSTPSEMSSKAEKFARRLTGRYNIPHQTWDERLTSFEAREFADPDKLIDAIAAKLILESYFRASQQD
jgi:putative Holliday junction resolvase